ncbi:MAG: uroporphyrinogen decarboxylase family protein, partial [Planctomycetota bacterium]|nr:uroporphyrinogen decarboxylase family protein [Planctomycetota bacterium]
FAGRSLDELPPPATLVDHPLVRQFGEQIETIRREGRHQPIPPFFWDSSGRAAVHGALTTAQKFLGASVFMDLVADPDSVMPVLDWITDTNAVLVNHFAKIAGIEEIEQIHIGECSACMVGGSQFEELIVPQASRLGETVAAVRLHSCGKSDHLLPAFAKISSLGSLDLGGETSMARVRDVFGPDFPVAIAPPVTLLSADEPTPVLDWAARTFEENAGGRLTIVCHLEPQYNLAAIRALARQVTD